MVRLHDYRMIEFTLDVKPRQKLPWSYKYTAHMGQNAKQSRINLK